MVEGSLAQALAGLKTSGLSGRYLQQASKEFTSRTADAASALPFLLAEASENRGKANSEARSQLMQDRAAMQQSAAGAFNQRLKELRTAGSSALKAKEAGKGDGASRSVHNALIIAVTGYSELLKNSGKSTEEGTEIHPPRTDQEWRRFATQVAEEAEGADPVDAMNAVKILRERINRKVKKGNLRPLGIVLHPGTTSG